MAQEKGMRLTCDRCKASVFLKFEGMEPQEWSQPREKYEDCPDGWAEAISLGRNVHLCPVCAERWVFLQNQFMREEQPWN